MTYNLNLALTFQCIYVGFCENYCEIIPKHDFNGRDHGWCLSVAITMTKHNINLYRMYIPQIGSTE